MEKRAKRRSIFIGLFFTLFVVYLLGRLYLVQVVEASTLLKKAEQNWTDQQTIFARRGTIMDRNNKPLAEDSTAYTVALDPQTIYDRKIENDVAKGLAAILSATPDGVPELEKKIYGMATKKRDDTGKFYAEVEIKSEGWKIDGETKQKVDQFVQQLKAQTGYKNLGVYTKEDKRRYYPNNRLASHVLGFLDKDGTAKAGLESQYNDLLSGKNGKLTNEKDRKGIELPDSKMTYIPAENGKNIRLTIDQNIQYYLENALKKSFDQYHPKSTIGIVSDPKTMEILAMANVPDFNPNKYWEFADQQDFLNRAISSQYEPGSTFKVVTLAGTIEEGVFNPNDKYQSGAISVGGRTIHDHNIDGWGRITFLEGLLRSSNVGFVKLGQLLGNEKLKSYIQKFGFGEKTGIDLPGEVKGGMAMKYESEYASATYGQGQVTATALQMAAAYGAIANGGKMMWPHVVKDIVDPDTGETVVSVAPKVVRQVVSEETARQTVLDLEQVVANQDMGTGKRAYINGYRIAGKTGTASIVSGGGKYSDNTWLISFVGFAPVENPQIMITILSQEPDIGGNYHLGSDVWVPIFRDVMTQTLSYMGVPASTEAVPAADKKKTTVSAAEPVASVPDALGFTIAQAKNVLTQVGLKAEVLGSGDKVLKQFPAPGTQISLSQRIYLLTDPGQSTNVPDMSGKSMREAAEMCSLLQLSCKMNGEGYVVNQSVSGEGTEQTVTLELKPLADALQVLAALNSPPQAPSAKAQDNPKKSPAPAKKPDSSSAANKTTPTPSPSTGKKAP